MEKKFKKYLFVDKMDYVKKKKPINCIFCDLKLIEDTLIKEIDDFLIVLNKYPFNPGHLMIIPKRHIEDIDELSEIEFLQLFNLLKFTKRILKKTHNPDAFNIGINLGKVAGGSVRHLHIHIVPRYNHELNFLEVTSGTRVIVEKLEDTFKKIQKEIEENQL